MRHFIYYPHVHSKIYLIIFRKMKFCVDLKTTAQGKLFKNTMTDVFKKELRRKWYISTKSHFHGLSYLY